VHHKLTSNQNLKDHEPLFIKLLKVLNLKTMHHNAYDHTLKAIVSKIHLN
jgi:hypothetical protein